MQSDEFGADALGSRGTSKSRDEGTELEEGDDYAPSGFELPGSPRVIGRSDHTISRKQLDADCLKVMGRLIRHGYQAFLVGGAVRDVLLGKRPKDFDVATDARPEVVRSLFRNSRIIGRRFRINHVYFAGNKIIEVATFRAQANSPEEGEPLVLASDNTYGNPESDARRRDLTINGLFYDLRTFSVIDYVGGIEDLENRVVRVIGEPSIRFQEDPVRMIRAVRHAARTDFSVEDAAFRAIGQHRASLQLCPVARLYEELVKDIQGGAARATFQLFIETGLITYILPFLHAALDEDHVLVWERLSRVLGRVDEDLEDGREVPNSVILAAITIGTLPESIREKQLWGEGTDELFEYFSILPDIQGTLAAPQESDADNVTGVPSRRRRRSKITKMSKVLQTLFETSGVSRRERDEMEGLLILRARMLEEHWLEEKEGRSEFVKHPLGHLALLLMKYTTHCEEAQRITDVWSSSFDRKRSSNRGRRRRGPRRG